MAYISLHEKSRYIHEVTKGAGRELRDDEATAAEEYADVYIEGKLGKSWDATYPTLIIRLADMIASAMAWQYIHSGQSPKSSEYAEVLQNQADGILDQILAGTMGIKLASGAWDPDYPGTANKEDKVATKLEIIV